MEDKKAPQKILTVVNTHDDVVTFAGFYELERADGTGTPFMVNAKTYQKTFHKNPLFKVKKNYPKQP